MAGEGEVGDYYKGDLSLLTVLLGSKFSNISEKAKTRHPSTRENIEGVFASQ